MFVNLGCVQFVLSVCFVIISIRAGAQGDPLAHFGDVRLKPIPTKVSTPIGSDSVEGVLQVYYREDNQEPDWRPVCKKGFVDGGADAICRMLGYERGDSNAFTKSLTPQQNSYALTNLSCVSDGEPPSHLLRCRKYDRYIPGDSCDPLVLICYTSMGFPFRKQSSKYPPYEGQVQLCPPDQVISDRSSIARQASIGIVSVFEHGKWGSLNRKESSRLSHQQASSICRQMGFTGAVVDSVRTVGSYNGTYTFSKCLVKDPMPTFLGIQKVWVTVNQSKLCSEPCPCFSCCYTQPVSGETCNRDPNEPEEESDDHYQCPKGYCCRRNDIIIECTFDPTIIPPDAGSESVCSFHNGQTMCASLSSEGLSTLDKALIGALVPGGLIILVVVIVVSSLIGIKIRNRRRDGYEQVAEENPPEERARDHNGGGEHN